jgi:hypothetical protein
VFRGGGILSFTIALAPFAYCFDIVILNSVEAQMHSGIAM